MAAVLDREHMIARVADWERRLDDMFGRVESVARRAGIGDIKRVPIPPRLEEMMKRFHVDPPSLRKLVLAGPNGTLEIIPKALGAIGANGRLDVVIWDLARNGRAAMLVDAGEPDSGKPIWKLYSSKHYSGIAFDDEAIDGLVREIA